MNRTRLKKIFVADDIITVRDDRSLGLLESLEFRARLVPDSAFLLEAIENTPNLEKPKVGFALRGGFLTQAEEEAIPEIIETLEKK
jgi:polysaccharide pyruvyl transferase WcaK-like protein